jgi:hypothetical protein
MEAEHWNALATANHRIEALARHLFIAKGYGDDAEISRIRSDIASLYALRRRLLGNLAGDISPAA